MFKLCMKATCALTLSRSKALVLLLLFSFFTPSYASDYQNEAQLLADLEIIVSDTETAPNTILKSLDELIQFSQEQNYDSAYIQVMLAKAELLFNSDNKTRAQNTLEQLLISTDVFAIDSSLKTQARIKLLELAISDTFGEVFENQDKREDLLELAAQVEDDDLKGDIYLGIGHSEFDADQFASSIESLKLAYNSYENAQNNEGLGSVLSTLGNINVTIGNVESGIKDFKQALVYAKLSKNKFVESILLYNISQAYFQLEQYDAASASIEETVALSIELQDEIGVTWANFMRGRIYLEQEQWQQAAELLQSTTKEFKQSGYTTVHFQSLLALSFALSRSGQIDEAFLALQQAQLYANKVNTDSNMMQYTRGLSRVNYAQGNYQEAYDYLEQVLDLQSKIHKQEQAEQIQKYRIEFDSDLKDRQNEALQRESDLKSELLSQKQQLENVWLALAVASILILTMLGYSLYTQIKKRNQYKELAHIDLLTKAPNRRSILQKAKLQFADAKSGYFCVALLDIDNFKRVNDTYGHEAGDEVLIAFAKACELALRGRDGYGRYGGEEWLLVFDGAEASHIVEVYKRLRDKVQELKPSVLPESLALTFSMGVATYNASKDSSLNQLISRADALLYEAKNKGKDQIALDSNV